MKLNMKRVALGLCMAACLFSLSACSKADTASSEIDVNIQAQLSQMASGYLNSYVNIPDDQLDEETRLQSRAKLLPRAWTPGRTSSMTLAP